jgi:methionyl-tRNA synthetase
VQGLYETREYGKALREVMAFADEVNLRFDGAAPWKLLKEGKGEERRRSAPSAWRLQGADRLPEAGAAGAGGAGRGLPACEPLDWTTRRSRWALATRWASTST